MKSQLIVLFTRLMIIITSIMVSSYKSSGQGNYNPLKIGDKVPDLVFNKLKNYPIENPTVSHFSGKLLVLDFWSSSCVNCIAAFPKLEEIQRKFDDQVQVILINATEDEKMAFQRIQKMKRYRQGIGLSDLPTLYGDSSWKRLFPHQTMPHHVWVDKFGYVKAITHGYNTTEKNIQTVLNDQNIAVGVKEDSFIEPNSIRDDGLMKPSIQGILPLSYSAISKWAPSMSSLIVIEPDTVNGFERRLYTYMSIVDLYKYAFYDRADQGIITLVESKDSTNLSVPKDKSKLDSWKTENLYAFEILTPINKKHTINDRMQKELNSFFAVERGIQGRIKRKKVETFILAKRNKSSTKGGTPEFSRLSNQLVWKSYPWSKIVKTLSSLLEDNYPGSLVIDATETPPAFSVDLTIKSSDLRNWRLLKKRLNTVGFDLIRNREKRNVLVVEDIEVLK